MNHNAPLYKMSQVTRFEKMKEFIKPKEKPTNVFVIDETYHGKIVEDTILSINDNINVIRKNVIAEYGYKVSDVIKSIDEIIDFAKQTDELCVVNCSFSIEPNEEIAKKIKECEGHGVIFVCALGENEKEYNHLPGTIENTIVVGCLDKNLKIHSKSNKFEGEVDCYVPCVDVDIKGQTFSGSSAGCAMVSAAICELYKFKDIKKKNPSWKLDLLSQFEKLITKDKKFRWEFFNYIKSESSLGIINEEISVSDSPFYQKAVKLSELLGETFSYSLVGENLPLEINQFNKISHTKDCVPLKIYDYKIKFEFNTFEFTSNREESVLTSLDKEEDLRFFANLHGATEKD